MPAKNGRFTRQEQTFVSVMAKTGDKASAARAAGYKSAASQQQLMTRPAIQAAVRDAALAELHNDLLPLANSVLRMALDGSVVVPWGAKMTAVQIVHKRVFGEQEGGSGKTPAEMSPDELSAALDRLKRELSERSVSIIDATPEPSDSGVFD